MFLVGVHIPRCVREVALNSTSALLGPRRQLILLPRADPVMPRLPSQDDLTKPKEKLPTAGNVRRRMEVDKRVQQLRPRWPMVRWLLMQPLQIIAWIAGLIPFRVRLGAIPILAVWLGGSWWINRPAATEFAAATAAATPVIETEPVPKPAVGPKYLILRASINNACRPDRARATCW